ncbi:FAD-binding oxidoreductase [soil metagenome]
MSNAQVIDKPVGRLTGFEKLEKKLEGRVFSEGHAKYDESRVVWNALRDRRPAAVVRPANVKDVVETVRFAKQRGYLVSAKSGGHGVSGGAVRDGGTTIDFSLWKSIEIDAVNRIAKAQPGLTWGEYDSATQEFGLATPGGKVSTVGLGGSGLGGGIGWLVRKHGLAIDNLRSVEMVTGEGRLLRASAIENADLFLGVRGAGAMLGIVTSFEYDLHPVGPVVAGLVAHPIERVREVLAFYREFAASAPEELTSVAVLMHGSDGSKIAGIAVTYAGDPEEGEKVIAPLRAFGPPVMDMIGTMPYGLLQRELAKMAVPGVNRAMKSAFFDMLSGDLAGKLADAFIAAPTADPTILFEHYGGAANRVATDATAYPHRNAEFNLVIDTGWRDHSEGRDTFYWLANTWNGVQPLINKAAYVSFLDADDSNRGVEAYGEANFARLRDLKQKYDPEHMLATFPGPKAENQD